MNDKELRKLPSEVAKRLRVAIWNSSETPLLEADVFPLSGADATLFRKCCQKLKAASEEGLENVYRILLEKA